MTTTTGRPVPSTAMENLNALEAAARDVAKKQAAYEAALVKRNDLIVHARIDNYPWSRIGSAVGLGRQATEQAARKGNGGILPQPRQRG